MTRTKTPDAPATGLTGPDDSRLVRAAEEYAEILRAGGRPDRAAFLARHADIADALAKCLDGLEFLRDAGNDLSRPGAGEPADGADLLLAGLPLGDYQLIRELGRGGMGIVYEAEQLSLGRRVALKVLPFAATMDGKQLQRFKNEARAAAGLHHEHIVPVYGVGCDRGVHYYAMQLIDGVSLAQMIQRASGRPPDEDMNATASEFNHVGLTPRRSPDTVPIAALSTEPGGRKGREFYRTAAQLIADAADALEHAHALGIVHRDVKPGNLLVDAAGKGYVSDFGLARFGPDAGLTMSGDLLGTLRYMAPEQAMARHGLADHRVDLYGLGATLYELLTGRPVVRGEDKADILRQIAFEDPTPLRKADRAIPGELETVALKCLAKNPADRYPTAGELAADLRRWLDDKPIKAKAPTVWQHAARRLRRHPRAVAAVVMGLLLMAVGATASTGLIYREKRQTETALGQVKDALARADRQRRLARKAVDQLTSSMIYDWMVRQVTPTAAQKEFLRQAGDLYREFTGEAAVTEEERAEVADAHYRFGIQRRYLGLAAEAELPLARARDQYELLAADFPDQPEHQVHLASTLVELGHFFGDRAQAAEQHHSYSRAVEVMERVVAAEPSNPSHRFQLAEAYHQLAIDSPHDTREALCRKALGILDELVAKDSQPRFRRELAAVNVSLGRWMMFRGRTAEARTYCRRAVDLFEQLVHERHPNHGIDVAGSYMNLGSIASREGNLEEAEKYLAASVWWRENLAKSFPGDRGMRANVPVTLLLLGQVQVRRDRPAAAEQTFRKMIAAMENLAAGGPLSNNMRDYHAGSHNRLGSVLAATGRLAEAEQSCRRGLELAEQLEAEVPGVGSYVDEHATGRTELGNVLFHLGQQDEAASHFRRAVPLRQRLLEIGRKDFEARHHRRLADLLSNCPDPAVRNPARAVAVARRAVEIERNDGDNYQSLGMAVYRSGDWPAAAAALTKAVELRPGKAVDRLFLAMARWRLGETDRARELYDHAVEWTAKHWPNDPDLRRLRAESAHLLGIEVVTAGSPEGPAKKP